MIPLSTTTIAVLRVDPATEFDEPYAGTEPLNRVVAENAVRAVIDHPAGTVEQAGGQQNVAGYGLKCDPVDIVYDDLIQDETTGRTYAIEWIIFYPDHVEARLYDTEGEV